MTTYVPRVKLVDLMIPKTGTSWRLEVYKNEFDPSEFRGIYERGVVGERHEIPDVPLLTGKKVVTFVRHPVTWLQSRYFMGTTGGPHCPISKIFEDAGGDVLTFQEMVDIYLEKAPGSIGQYFRLYTQVSKFIGRYERLRYDMAGVLGWLGVSYDRRFVSGSPVVNKTDKAERPWASSCVYREGQWEAVCEAEVDFLEEFYHA